MPIRICIYIYVCARARVCVCVCRLASCQLQAELRGPPAPNAAAAACYRMSCTCDSRPGCADAERINKPNVGLLRRLLIDGYQIVARTETAAAEPLHQAA
jgi:hypothetical protein